METIPICILCCEYLANAFYLKKKILHTTTSSLFAMNLFFFYYIERQQSNTMSLRTDCWQGTNRLLSFGVSM